MADSVGKIQLDIEINPSSISRELGSLNKTFASSMQGMFGNIKNFAKNTFGDIAGQIRKVAGVKDEILPDADVEEMSAKFGGSIKRMEEKMASLRSGVDKTNSKIAELRTSMADLLAEQDAIARGYAEMPTISGLTKDESMEKLLSSDTRYRKLSAEIEALELRIQSLGNRNKQAAGEMETLGRAMDRVKESTSQASGANEQLGRSSSRAGQITERAGRQFSNAGDRAKKSTGKVAGFALSMQRAFARVLKQIFIIALMYKAIRGMIEYTGAALKTNQGFMRSLNQVKTNLQVAFMPIYQAILPALNTFMAWLTKATAYIASFTSALFGKTYKQSFQAAKGLNAAKKSLEGTGKAAKKAAGSLAAFDEINILSEPQEDEDTGSGLTAPSMDMDAVDREMGGLAEKFKSVLSKLWQPFKAAWENEGAATIAAARHALGGVWALVKEIGKSFVEVWTNGTGQAILEVILRILQQIFGLIGDIGFTFANAWAEGGRGTAIVQGIANVFLHLLELVERIGISLRNVWGEIGPTVARFFLGFLDSTIDVLENLTEKLVWVWDHGGSQLLEGLGRLLAAVLEVAGEIYSGFVAPLLNWIVDMLAPVVGRVLESLVPVLDKLAEKLLYVWNNGGKVLFENLVRVMKAIISIVLPFIELIITKVLAPLVMWILDKIAPALSWLLEKVGWVLGKIATFFEWLYDVLIGHSIIPDLINGIKTWFERLVGWVTAPVKTLVNAVVGLWNDVKTQAVNIFNGIKDTITGAFNAAKTTVLNIWDTITSRLTGAFNTIYNNATGIFSRLKSFIGGICDSISGFFKGMVNGVIRALNGMIGGLNKLKFDVPDWVPGLGGNKFGFDIPKIPQLARGAIVEQPTLAMIGEKRKKEAVLPLEQNTGWMDTLAGKIAAIMGGGGGGGGEDGPLIIQVMIGGNKVLEEIIDAAKRKNAKAGKTIVQLGV